MKRKICFAAWALALMLLLPLCAALAEATDGEAEYYGTIGKKMTVYKDANEDSAQLGKIEAGTVVDVYKKGRTWTRIGYESGQGYVLTKFVEMVQRKNPFDGRLCIDRHHVYAGRIPLSHSGERGKLAVHPSDQGWARIFPVSQAGR